jgi:hypothetical protein
LRRSGRGVHPAWPHPSIDEQRQLPAQKQILGANSLRRTEQQHQPPDGVLDQTKRDPSEGDHRLIVPHHSVMRWQVASKPDAILAKHSRLPRGA